MPTGYTARIYDGETLTASEFAAECARAFGAFMHQRDDSSDAALRYPDPPSNSFYKTELTKSKQRAQQWANMSEEDKYKEWSEYYNQRVIDLHENIARNSEMRARYQKVLANVHAVEVDSTLANFKNFMVEQLTSGLEFDCGADDKFTAEWYQPPTYVAWCEGQEKDIARNDGYYEEKIAEEQKRYEEACAFIDNMAATFGFEVEKNES